MELRQLERNHVLALEKNGILTEPRFLELLPLLKPARDPRDH